ncbi:branched-chain-amino-acid aminotransferase 3, chloroplastic-like [Dorcoceras hygrometricum]|uniref:Branched-chain-amino-acid aminotransferase 3, chloroplastic-like n=1 Tax=Dorcoceras hygrometricum TaxID=472368 RepID=A0A2Z7DDU7_9LAMI|nr:branched-chain-amino-acid aminotransferase 3, chloroplastic-like [Dorcoceras hygrometricum]
MNLNENIGVDVWPKSRWPNPFCASKPKPRFSFLSNRTISDVDLSRPLPYSYDRVRSVGDAQPILSSH